MRIEFTDETALWDWSGRRVLVGPGWDEGKEVGNLKLGDIIAIANGGEKVQEKTVHRVIGDDAFREEGGSWYAIHRERGGHPRQGVIYAGSRSLTDSTAGS